MDMTVDADSWYRPRSKRLWSQDIHRSIERDVGVARSQPDEFRLVPQEWLEASNHPYAPFPSDTITWESWAWHDASTYEGLTKLEQPHGRGVFILGRGGKGAGLRNAKMGDKYEGDFYYGLAHGVGMRTGASGRVYRGEWLDGAPDGCGVEYNLGPWLKAVKKGRRPDLAFKDVRREVVGKMRVGMWRHGIYVADAVEDSPSLCTFSEIRSLMNETTDVVTKARQFVHKPGGDAAFYKAHLDGVPLRVMQHPLHYPQDTMFMAPGPIGQTAALPNDPELKRQMLQTARNHRTVFKRYNFDIKPKKGSFLWKAMHSWAKTEAEREAEEDFEDEMWGLTSRDPPVDFDYKHKSGKSKKSEKSERKPSKRAPKQDIDDDDLVADAAAMLHTARPFAPAHGPRLPVGQRTPPAGSAFGSITAVLHGAPFAGAFRQKRATNVGRFVQGPTSAVPMLLAPSQL